MIVAVNRALDIGLTIGVWDCWHDGHVSFLRQAKEKCSYLIVGTMTDFWVRVQKGHEGRPQNSLAKRIEDVRNSGLADRVISIDTLDMSQYLQICDVWIKGQDQKNMLPEDFRNVVYLKRLEGISTTSIIRRD